MEAFFVTLLTFFSTLFGGFFAFRNIKRLHYIMSFTAGVLVAVCFFDIMPEIFSLTQKEGLPVENALIAIVFGFLLIHTLEKLALIHMNHEEEYAEHKHPTVGLISASALTFHSFLDGAGIGLGFQVSPQIGLLIAIAVIAHDFSDGLNTVTLMLSHKNSNKRTLFLLFLDALAPVIGVLSTFIINIPDALLQLYLGFFVGFLLYIGASDLLPEAHSQHSSWKMVGLTILGVAFIFIVTRFTQ